MRESSSSSRTIRTESSAGSGSKGRPTTRESFPAPRGSSTGSFTTRETSCTSRGSGSGSGSGLGRAPRGGGSPTAVAVLPQGAGLRGVVHDDFPPFHHPPHTVDDGADVGVGIALHRDQVGVVARRHR